MVLKQPSMDDLGDDGVVLRDAHVVHHDRPAEVQRHRSCIYHLTFQVSLLLARTLDAASV